MYRCCPFVVVQVPPTSMAADPRGLAGSFTSGV
jgi:hypothetical protein